MSQRWEKKNRYYRLLAWVVLFLFTGSHLEAGKTPKVYTIKLQQKACDVKERWKGEADKTIIHIQDAHASIDAQKNITKIIRHLVETDEINLVGVEGASKEINLDDLRKHPSAEAKHVVTDWYLEDGVLSGTEQSLITAKEEFRLVGVEDREIFRKNFRAFYGTQLKRDDIIEQIHVIEEIIQDLKTPIYNDALKLFDATVTSWYAGETAFTDYLFELHQNIIDLGIDIYDSIHYAAFYETLKMQSGVPEMTLKSEYETLETMIQDQIVTLEEEEAKKAERRFSRTRVAYERKEISEKDYLSSLRHMGARLNIDFKTFRILTEHLKYLEKFSRLDMEGVLREVDELTLKVQLRLAKEGEEKELVLRSHHIRMLEKLSSLESMSYDVAYFKTHFEQFRFSYFHSFILEKTQKYGRPNSVSPTDKGIDKILKYITHFYTGAEIRNKVLVENTLKQMDNNGQRVAALVAGGYHSDGITDILRQKGISYLVVTPKINDLERVMPYKDKMMGNLFSLSPALLSKISIVRAGDLAGDDFDAFETEVLNLMDTGWALSSAGAALASEKRELVRAVSLMLKTMVEQQRISPSNHEQIASRARRFLEFAGNYENFRQFVEEGLLQYSEDPANKLYILVTEEAQQGIGEENFGIIQSLQEINPKGIEIITNVSDLDGKPLDRVIAIATDDEQVAAIPRDAEENVPLIFKFDKNQLPSEIAEVLYGIFVAVVNLFNDPSQTDDPLRVLRLVPSQPQNHRVFVLQDAAIDKIKEAQTAEVTAQMA